MGSRAKGVTIADVAARAGVSLLLPPHLRDDALATLPHRRNGVLRTP